MSDIKKFIEFIKLNESRDDEYYVIYCSNQSGHGELSDIGDFYKIYKLAIKQYSIWLKTTDLEFPNDKIIYVGVNCVGSGNKFAIIYISQSYYDNMDIHDFDTEQSYNSWMKVAKQCLDTNKPQIGYYSEYVDDKQLSLF